MNDFWTKLIINVVIGIIVFGGFFAFWGRSAGWFKKGGLVYEYFHKKKSSKKVPTKKDIK